jgi:hypothetical protein
LNNELKRLQEKVEYLDAALAFHPRAAKLMGKRKNFLVVAEDEHYYADVYLQIKIAEEQAGRWTDEDERLFQLAWEAAWKAAQGGDA